MANLIGIRLFRHDYGDIIEVVEKLRPISVRTIITEELTPYQHYHILIYTDKSEKQVKRYLPKQKNFDAKNLRLRNNINVCAIKNEGAYIKYIKKNFVRGFDSCFGWLTCDSEYKEYAFDNS